MNEPAFDRVADNSSCSHSHDQQSVARPTPGARSGLEDADVTVINSPSLFALVYMPIAKASSHQPVRTKTYSSVFFGFS